MRRLKKFFFGVLTSITSFLIIVFVAFWALYYILPSQEEGDGSPKAKENSILELSFPSTLKDYGGTFQIKMVTYKNKEGLISTLQDIEWAMTDDRIKGISLNLSNIKLGLTQIREIRNKLKKFKTSGKFVYAYATEFSQRDYYLASVADSIFINPHGSLSFKGLSSEVLYFKDFQQQYGINFDVVQKGKYKGIPEMLSQNTMSEDTKSHIYKLLQSIWRSVTVDVSETRNIDKSNLNKVAKEGLAKTSHQALTQKFVDGLAYWDEYESALKNKLGVDTLKTINYIKPKDFSLQTPVSQDKNTNLIAVIFAEGHIRKKGKSSRFITPKILRKSLKEVRENDQVKAIVIRINSPGGDALASEEIWREISITKEKKPVIVSLGDVAASGGYYIACGADKIFANPSTITGSIGVFGILPNIEKFAQKHGVQSDQVALFEKSIDYSPFKSLTEEQRKDFQTETNRIYDLFLKRVSEARNIPLNDLRKLAEGKVWSGEQALENGLVDSLGSLEDVIAYTLKTYNISNHNLMLLPVYKVGVLNMVSAALNVTSLSETQEKKWLQQSLGEKGYALYNRFNTFFANKGIQAFSPLELLVD